MNPDLPVVRVTGGNPTDDELAAVIAVVTEHYAEEAATATVEDGPSHDAWTRSHRLRRYSRQPWGRFSG
ncbi:acyl-CoA carboxylase subunit epsilon [Microbacterium karelineae]|uniref:acyl-CoA carboxylase subunit epsilon n=1 Tax=Microbacterium karelineae TaxID=2654283 RepID=UPI0012EAFE2D|nr:acyl-CoA carboxylase subunit epsilon [Microbacterium karelineae]